MSEKPQYRYAEIENFGSIEGDSIADVRYRLNRIYDQIGWKQKVDLYQHLGEVPDEIAADHNRKIEVCRSQHQRVELTITKEMIDAGEFRKSGDGYGSNWTGFFIRYEELPEQKAIRTAYETRRQAERDAEDRANFERLRKKFG